MALVASMNQVDREELARQRTANVIRELAARIENGSASLVGTSMKFEPGGGALMLLSLKMSAEDLIKEAG